MAKAILLDEFHVTVWLSGQLHDREVKAVRRTLDGSRFQRKFLKAVRQVFAQEPSLRRLTIKISR